MPYLKYTRLPGGVSPVPSSTSEPATSEQLQSSKHVTIDREGWPPFPPPQSLSDDTSQLHLTLRRSHSPSPSPTPSPLHSRQLSSGEATPESDSCGALAVTGTTNGLLEPPSSDRQQYNKQSKKNRLSAAALASLLSASHGNEDRSARKERKRVEKHAKREQTLQELRGAERRRSYFRDASHRREHTFGPEVRTMATCTE
jgi:hypothetical protein